jgi:rubrerythrin
MDDEKLRLLLEANAAETRKHFDERAAAIEQHVDEKVAETKQHFDVVVERMESKFGLLSESVDHLAKRLERETKDIRDEVRSGFADTQAMIKFSHAELDRRVRTLEEVVSDLQSRVERLESSIQ